jgi:hypothetical protein
VTAAVPNLIEYFPRERVETYSYSVIYYDFLPNFLKNIYIGVFSGTLLQY